MGLFSLVVISENIYNVWVKDNPIEIGITQACNFRLVRSRTDLRQKQNPNK